MTKLRRELHSSEEHESRRLEKALEILACQELRFNVGQILACQEIRPDVGQITACQELRFDVGQITASQELRPDVGLLLIESCA